jgi:hypothetical protein
MLALIYSRISKNHYSRLLLKGLYPAAQQFLIWDALPKSSVPISHNCQISPCIHQRRVKEQEILATAIKQSHHISPIGEIGERISFITLLNTGNTGCSIPPSCL